MCVCIYLKKSDTQGALRFVKSNLHLVAFDLTQLRKMKLLTKHMVHYKRQIKATVK